MDLEARAHDRRSFLLTAAALAVTARQARSQARFDPAIRKPDVGAAIRAVVATGRPLLILVGSSDASLSWHEAMWSSFLMGASDEQFAMLAIVDLLCAEWSVVNESLVTLLGNTLAQPWLTPETLLVLVQPEHDTIDRCSRVKLECPATWRDRKGEYVTIDPMRSDESYQEYWSRREHAVATVIVRRDHAIRAFLESELGQIRGERDEGARAKAAKYVSAARARLSTAEIERVEAKALGLAALGSDLLRRAAPLLLERAREFDVHGRAEIHAALARIVKREILFGDPSGGTWTQRGFGCNGPYFERYIDHRQDVPPRIECGIGYVPERERRFLQVLTDEDLRWLERRRR